jgi:anaerobic selenocysteine-containing dehydrogenase
MGVSGNVDVPGGNVFWVNVPIDFHENWDKLPPEQAKKRLGGDRYRVLSMGPLRKAHPPTVFNAILTGKPYPVKALVLFANNALCSYPNSKKVYEALKIVEFFVATDIFMTPTTEMADILLPAATWLERDEIQVNPFSGWYVGVRQKVVQTGECRSDWEIILELSERLGLRHGGLHKFIDEVLARTGTTFSELKERGWITSPMRYLKYEEAGFPATPSGKFEIYSQVLENLGYDPLPYHTEPPESPYSTPELAEKYPLILITGGRNPVFFHSEHRQIPWLRKIIPDPLVEMHPETAARLGIRDGDLVVIESPRGSCKQRARLTIGIDPRVVHAQHNWWFPEKLDPEHGVWESNVNILTDDERCDPATGSNPLRALLCRVYKSS